MHENLSLINQQMKYVLAYRQRTEHILVFNIPRLCIASKYFIKYKHVLKELLILRNT